MGTWWESLSILQQCFALAALPATLLLAIQTVLLLFGLGGDGGSDGHEMGDHTFGEHHLDGDAGHEIDSHEGGLHSDDGLRIFTVRAFIAFFAIFGWCGIALAELEVHIILNIVLSSAAGIASMLIMAYFFKMALKLQSSGNLDMRNSLGKTGTVYLSIPPQRSGKGKVTMIVQGRFMEVEAVTDCEETLKTGAEVVGVSISNQNVLCVVPKSSM